MPGETSRDSSGGFRVFLRLSLGLPLLLIVCVLQGCEDEKTLAGPTNTTDKPATPQPTSVSGSSTPAPAPAPAPRPPSNQVVQKMTVEAISYDSLARNATVMAEFESAVKRAVAAEAGVYVTPDMVSVVVSAGSVVVEATITTGSYARPVEVASTLDASISSTALQSAVVAQLTAIEGINDVSTGTIEVSCEPPVTKTPAPTPPPTQASTPASPPASTPASTPAPMPGSTPAAPMPAPTQSSTDSTDSRGSVPTPAPSTILCWSLCGNSGGFCDTCNGADGSAGACCKMDAYGNYRDGDPSECKRVPATSFPLRDKSVCVIVPPITSCFDVQPPSFWGNPTCESQLQNTDGCEKRRSGENKDGYCHKTCGVCTVEPTPAPTPAPPTPAPTSVPDGYKFVGQGYCSSGELSQCYDVQPPSSWGQPTCDAQWKNTDNCADRRSGQNNDPYCHKTCGVCSDSMPVSINCWSKCGDAAGFCDACDGANGARGACCKLQNDGQHRAEDPQECKDVPASLFPAQGSHRCVFAPTPPPSPARLQGYCPKAMELRTVTCTRDGGNSITSWGAGEKTREQCAQECDARAGCGYFFFTSTLCELYKECTNTRTSDAGDTWGKCNDVDSCSQYCSGRRDCEFFSVSSNGDCRIFSDAAGQCSNGIDNDFVTFKKWVEAPAGYQFIGRGRCKSNEHSIANEATHATDKEKCAQQCSNVNACQHWAFIQGQRCRLYKGSCSGDDFVEDYSYVAFSRASKNTYVPGTPGATWTRQEMLVVKAKLYKAFPPSGGRTVWGQLSQADRNDHPWNNNTWFSGADARKVLRLNFHDCLRYAEGGGGCDGCLDWTGMAFRYEATERRWHWDHDVLVHGHNNALKHTVLFLEELYTNRHYPSDAPSLPRSLKEMGKSRADFWAFAGKAAVEYGIESNNIFCDVEGQPKWNLRQHFGNVCQMNQEYEWCKINLEQPILFKSGRRDCVTNEDKPYKSPPTNHEIALHPQANGQMVLNYFREQFNMGARDTAAIMGAHTMAGMHVSHSLLRYGWTARNARFFNNAYYRLLVGKPDWRFDDDACTKLGDAFNEKPKSRWIAVAWLNTDVGGPVQWINEKYTCDPCHWNEYKNSACCTDVPSGQMCKSDRTGPQDTNYNTDNDIVWGCEGYKLIPGQDEAMLGVDMGMYFKFDVDENFTPKGCPGLEKFKTENWRKGLNLYSTEDGKWDRETGNWRKTYTAKKEPACPKNDAADPGDKPIYQIVEEYADNNNVFAADFARAFEKMLANGYSDSELTPAPDITTGVSCPADKVLNGYFECTDGIVV